MDYLITIYDDESTHGSGPAPGTPEFADFMAPWAAFNDYLRENGHWIAAGALQPTSTATTVRRAGGQDSVTDGPFAETKEALGGFYMVRAANLDEALALAKRIPLREGSLEVRPVSLNPDAE